MRYTKQDLINKLTNELSAKDIEINSLKSQLAKAHIQLKDNHNAEIIKIVYGWGQANESFSKALLALKGCL